MAKNRELSQLGSFVVVNDTNIIDFLLNFIYNELKTLFKYVIPYYVV